MHPKIAALDLGSNSFHLAIAECHAARRFTIAARCKEKVQLGRSTFETGAISASAFESGLDALKRLRRMIDAQRPDVTLAVATSAIREAANGAEFARHAELIVGVPVRIISGEEEARLVGLGTVQAVNMRQRRLAIFDLGGGSTEVVLADGHSTLLASSLQLGTLRLHGEWRCAERPTQAELTWLEQRVESVLLPTLRRIADAGFDTVVLSCGSARDLARLAQQLGPEPTAPASSPTLLTLDDVVALQRRLGALAPTERAALIGSDPRRADTLLVAATVFKSMLAGLQAKQAWVSSAGLRDGLVADHLASNQQTRSALVVAL